MNKYSEQILLRLEAGFYLLVAFFFVNYLSFFIKPTPTATIILTAAMTLTILGIISTMIYVIGERVDLNIFSENYYVAIIAGSIFFPTSATTYWLFQKYLKKWGKMPKGW